MSQAQQKAQVIIEFDRDWVRAYFADSATLREGASLATIEGISGKRAVVILSRRMVFHRAVSLPEASRSDTLTVLKLKLSEVFPLPPNSLAFDYLPTAERDMNGRVCDVYAAKIEDIREVLSLCDVSKIQVQKIVPAPALSIQVAAKEGFKNGIVAERFGDFINLDAIENGQLKTFRQANTNTVDTELARLKSVASDELLSFGVSLGGREQKLSGAHLTRFAELSPIIDLEPEEYRSQKEEGARAKRHRQGYLVFAAGLCVSALTINEASLDSAVREKAEKKAKNQLKGLTTIANSEESKLASLKPQADQIKRAFMPAQKTSDVIKVASLLVPKGAWLTGIVVERGKPMQIRGSATNSLAVAAYLDSLTKQKRFRDVRLLFSNRTESEGNTIVQFSVSAFPVGNLPIVETGSKKKK
jgi:Tfp pilus assembly protein PilN